MIKEEEKTKKMNETIAHVATKINLIEEYSHSKEGYNPFLLGSKWQVAQLNYEPDLAPNAIKKIDVHHKTDEAFLLMAGQAVLIAAEIENENISFQVINMTPRVVYNVPKECWHNIVLSVDAEVLIIEDANTHMCDYQFYYLKEGEKIELLKLIEKTWIN